MEPAEQLFEDLIIEVLHEAAQSLSLKDVNGRINDLHLLAMGESRKAGVI